MSLRCCSSCCRLHPHAWSPEQALTVPLPRWSQTQPPSSSSFIPSQPCIAALTCLQEELLQLQASCYSSKPDIYISKVNIRSSFLCLSLWCFVLWDSSDARNKKTVGSEQEERLVLSLSLLYYTACSGSGCLSCSFAVWDVSSGLKLTLLCVVVGVWNSVFWFIPRFNACWPFWGSSAIGFTAFIVILTSWRICKLYNKVYLLVFQLDLVLNKLIKS